MEGFRELTRDDVLSRVGFGELACQIFDDSGFDILQEELSTGEFFFSPEIDRYIALVSKAIDGIENTESALSSKEGIEQFTIAQEFARECIPLLERWLSSSNRDQLGTRGAPSPYPLRASG